MESVINSKIFSEYYKINNIDTLYLIIKFGCLSLNCNQISTYAHHIIIQPNEDRISLLSRGMAPKDKNKIELYKCVKNSNIYMFYFVSAYSNNSLVINVKYRKNKCIKK